MSREEHRGIGDEIWSNWDEDDDIAEQISAAPSLPREDRSRTSDNPMNRSVSTHSMRKVSSCYFSIHSNLSESGSVADLLSLWEETDSAASTSIDNDCSFLYHDILMNVFSFLDTDSLTAFSETSRRSNFEVFYFLQLELQQSLLPSPGAGGVPILARLAQLDRVEAEATIQEFLDSNSTLRRLPLTYSMAYVRMLVRTSHPQPRQALAASAALFMTLLGAASFLGSTDVTRMVMEEMSPEFLFVGFLGSLMGAAKTMDTNRLSRMMQAAYAAASGRTSAIINDSDGEDRLLPSGCVGAYCRARHRAAVAVRDIVKRQRKGLFDALPPDRQREVACAFIDACCSDDNLRVVKDLVSVRGIVDVEGFFVGSDGTETCGLHAAAFHGSCRILEFLCQGTSESDPFQDGGLCDVDRKDANGWTAVHFAAGANSVHAVKILAEHEAVLTAEATNGYTPLQWALRLQNESVAEELRRQLGHEQMGWIPHQPLSAIANRFLSMIPSH